MTVRIGTRLLLLALVAVSGCTAVTGHDTTTCTLGTNWTTVDDFYPGSGNDAASAEGAAAGNGKTIVVGGSGEVSTTNTWFTRRSTDGGATWTTVDSTTGGDDQLVFSDGANRFFAGGETPDWDVRASTDGGATFTASDEIPAGPAGDGEPLGGAVTGSGAAIVAGRFGSSSSKWRVRRYTVAGGWATVDDWAGAGVSAAGQSVAASGATVLVAGADLHGTSDHWVVRRSINDGVSWNGVEDLLDGTKYSSCAAGSVALDANGTAIAVGSCVRLSDSKNEWLARRSADGGATWTAAGGLGETNDTGGAVAVVLGSDGTAYAGGYFDRGTVRYWTVQKSTDGGATWTTVDNFPSQPGGDASVYALSFDGAGSLYAVGSFNATSTDPSHWLVRKLPCQ